MSAPATIPAAAEHYLRTFGWWPIRTGVNKRPAEGTGWGQCRHPPDQLAALFANAEGVGVLLGDRSGGLVDVDLDCWEAVELWPYFGPRSNNTFGRGSDDSQHQLYRCLGLKTTQYLDDKGVAILELRANSTGNGVQTVLPPSIHHGTGQPRRWLCYGPKLVEVEAGELTRAADRTASAALIVRYYPASGARHGFRLALAGLLLGECGFSADEAEHFAGAVASVTGDTDLEDWCKAVRSTAARVTAGELVTAGGKLAELLGDKPLELVRRWLRAKTGRADKGENQAETLIAILKVEAELWRTPEGDAFATVAVGEHLEHHRVGSRAFRLWLSGRFYGARAAPAASKALDTALEWAEAAALHGGTVHPVHRRVAGHDGAIYVDTGRDDWTVVRITANDWDILENRHCPAKLVRGSTTAALPLPERGGSVELLWRHLNIAEEDARTAIVGWCLGALRPDGGDGYAGLIFEGEAGSAKSTTSRAVASLIDPQTVQDGGAPRDETALLVTAKQMHCVRLDNLRGLPSWLSDALCRLSTGGGSFARKLYTDDDLAAFTVKRPWLANGIDQVAKAEDLIDRAVIVRLPPIADTQRRPGTAFQAAWGVDAPKVLGALYTAASAALRHLPGLELDRLPRLADWALFVEAAAPALGWERGRFVSALRAVQGRAGDAVLGEDPVAAAILDLLREKGGSWTGTYAALASELASPEAKPGEVSRWHMTRGCRELKDSRALGAKLKRLAKPLRERGVHVEIKRQGKANITTVRLSSQAGDAAGDVGDAEATFAKTTNVAGTGQLSICLH